MASGTGIAEPARRGPPTALDAWLGSTFGARFPLIAYVALLTGLFVAPLFIAALVFEDPNPIFWALLVLDLVALFVFGVVTYSRPALFVGVLILWFALQRLVIAVAAPDIDADMVRVLLTYKEGFCFILPSAAAIGLYLAWRRGERTLTPVLAADLVAVSFLVLVAVHFVAAGDPSTPELTYARRFAAPVLLYLGGRMLIPLLPQFTASLRLLVVVAVGVAVFGLVERFVFDIAFWSNGIDAATFYGKQVDSGLLPEDWTVIYRGVPDGIFIALPLEVPVRRLVSSYLEPTTLGSFFAFAILLVLLAPGLGSEKPRVSQRWLLGAVALLLAFAALATLSRGAMAAVLAGGALFVFVRLVQTRRWAGLPVVLGVIVALTMAVGFVITTFSTFPGDGLARDVLETRAVSGLTDEPSAALPPAADSGPGGLDEITQHPPGSTAEGASKHFDGLRSGLDRMLDEPLGAGLGAAGNWSDAPEAGGESTIGVVAAQTGVPGLLLYVGFYAAIIAALVSAAWKRSGPLSDLSLVLAGALFGLFAISFVSESALGLLGNAPYFIFAGWMLAIVSPAVIRPTFTALPATRSRTSPSSAVDGPARPGDTSTR